jgi:anti-sigma B factor antagonist
MSEAGSQFLNLTMEERGLTVLTINQKVLDASGTEPLTAEVDRHLEPGSIVILDLSAVEFVDSAGLAAFLVCARRLNAVGGKLQLCSPIPQVRHLLELVRFHRIVDIFNDLQEALRVLKSSA